MTMPQAHRSLLGELDQAHVSFYDQGIAVRVRLHQTPQPSSLSPLLQSHIGGISEPRDFGGACLDTWN